jgi:multisubunit Na+/H+ antiporter MnhG subunit
MDDKIKVAIGFILIILAIIFYLLSQVSQTLDNVGNNLLLIFLAMIAGVAGLFIMSRYLPKIL